MTYPSFGVLLVDDEDAFLRSMSISLERKGNITHIYTCNDSRNALQMMENNPIGLVLLDLTMPHISGETLLELILEKYPEVSVIILSGMNQLETVVTCIRKGAYDYFVKTTEETRLIDSVKRAIQMQEMRVENTAMRKSLLSNELEQPDVFANIITQDKGMHSVFKYLETVSVSSQPILITGESGVGKELIAKAVHRLSKRQGEMVSINTAGLDDHVFSDTLFGHKKGAFTGAEKVRPGVIEQAQQGTLFLDEIGDLNPASQIKLLRLLQEKEYFPLGSDQPKRMTARIIAATHKDLNELQKQEKFRVDLFFRLSTHQLEVPPLRNRKGDIPLLLEHFLAEAADELNKKKPAIPSELYALLANYHFPGNIRELRSLAYEAMSHHKSHILSMTHFYKIFSKEDSISADNLNPSTPIFHPESPLPSLKEIGDMLVDEAMRRSKGNQSLAARLLNISQPALNKRLNKVKKKSD